MYSDDASFYAFIFENSLTFIWKPIGYEYIYLNLSPDEVKEFIFVESGALDCLCIRSTNRDYLVWVDKKHSNKLDEYSKRWLEKYSEIPFSKVIAPELKIKNIDSLPCAEIPNIILFGGLLIYFIRHNVTEISEIYRSFIESHLSDEDVLMASLKVIQKFPIKELYPFIKDNFTPEQKNVLLSNLCDIMTKDRIIDRAKETLLYEIVEEIDGDKDFVSSTVELCTEKNHFKEKRIFNLP